MTDSVTQNKTIFSSAVSLFNVLCQFLFYWTTQTIPPEAPVTLLYRCYHLKYISVKTTQC